MKLTPLDIHHKEFNHALRGYNEAEVDEFLDQVADELERLFKENIDLSERIEAAEGKVHGYQDMERTLNNTLVSAQRSAEEIIAKAEHEASIVLKDAEVKAKEIIHGALQQKQKATSDLVRIKQAEESFRASFKKLLDVHLGAIKEIELPKDMQLLTAQAGDETVAEVQVGSAPAAAGAPVGTPRPQQRAAVTGPRPAPVTQDTAPIEPPKAGFVQGLQLGELSGPDLGPGEPVFEAPEFKLDFGSLGERDEDIDIEEID